jgi:hypothetical protein
MDDLVMIANIDVNMIHKEFAGDIGFELPPIQWTRKMSE